MAKHFPVTYRGTVYPWQCDHMGHMNVMGLCLPESPYAEFIEVRDGIE